MSTRASSSLAGDWETISNSQSAVCEHGLGPYSDCYCWSRRQSVSYTTGLSAATSSSALPSPLLPPTDTYPPYLALGLAPAIDVDDNNIGEGDLYNDPIAEFGRNVEATQVPLEPNLFSFLPGHHSWGQHGQTYIPGYGFPYTPFGVYLQTENPSAAPNDQTTLVDALAHLDVSSGHRDKFVCSCGQTYQRKQELTRHRNQETAGRKWTCEHEGCDFSCKEKKNLMRHSQTHRGTQDRFFCDVHSCEGATKGFTRHDNYLRHMKKYHSVSNKRIL